MSYTEIFGFDKEGNAYMQEGVKNAWRGGMAIWSTLEERYLPAYKPSHVPAYIPVEAVEKYLGYKPSRTGSMFDQSAMKEIWGLFDNKELPEIDRIVLGTTFDFVIVKKEDLARLIVAFESFEGNTNLKEQVEVFKKMAMDEDCVAVGWNQTSVNGDTWENYGGYDDETDESIPYNIITGDKHWSLFEEIGLTVEGIDE